ncbi:ZIP family metal transporter [Bacillus songklensis]|uniref:ZIP family metal transporter n=1 Tax=Bacillus songklensis TaxID=1069116 RepID=UPI00366F34A7
MSGVWNFALWAMVSSFVGMGIGGVVGKIICSFLKRSVYYVYSCCGGMITGLLLMEMVPHSIHYYGGLGVAAGMFNGYVFMKLIESQLHKHFYASDEALLPYFLFMAIILHSIPFGLNIGLNAGYTAYATSSFLLAFILHQIPEGVALIAALKAVKMSDWLFIVMMLVLAAAFGVSIWAGHELNIESVKLNALLTGGSIGSFCYVTMNEFLRKSIKGLSFAHFAFFFLVGIFSIKIYLLVL